MTGLIVGVALTIGLCFVFRHRLTIALTDNTQPDWMSNACIVPPSDDRGGLRIDDQPSGTESVSLTSTASSLSGNFITRYGMIHNNNLGGVIDPSNTNPSGNGDGSSNLDPNFVKGGNISKCVLYSLLKSLDEHDQVVEYRFGMDGNKNILILKGGNRDQNNPGSPLSKPMVYRTGTQEDCFCPNHCSDWCQ
jgi:hypothetical protein